MEQTIIGAFDNIYRAQAAKQALLSAGFDADEITVQANNSDDDSSVQASDREDNNDSFLDGIGNFFSSLFGNEHEHAQHYSETVRRGGAVVSVTVEEAARAATARAALAQSGAFDIEKRAAEWQNSGSYDADTSDRYDSSDSYESSDSDVSRSASYNDRSTDQRSGVLPVIEEEMEVGKREVDLGAVRVYARTVEKPVEENIELQQQHATIRREAVDRPATAEDLASLRSGLIEVREMEERAVINKTARVVEEVSVETVKTSNTETISDTLKNTVVEVERDGGNTTEQGYRKHYASNFADDGEYEDYAPAYQYGSSLASDSRYRNRHWDDIEYDARSDWDSRYPQSAWDKFKSAIQHGWESMTGSGDRR